MNFDDDFYNEILNKKKEFEQLSEYEQKQTTNFNSESINSEFSYQEVSDAIDCTKFNKAYLEIPNEALKNKNAKEFA